jgi:hypothetical protein
MARNYSETRNLLAGGRREDLKNPARACATLQALCFFTGFSREGRGDRRLSAVFEDAGSVFNTQAGPGPNTQY